MPQAEVSFDIDANGILNVSAKDKGTGKEQKIRVNVSDGLSDDEINRMVNEAKQYEEEDRKRKQEIEERNEADQLDYTTEKSLKEYGDKVSEDDRKNIESALTELKTAIESNNFQQIKEKKEALMKASHKLAEQMYAGANPQGQPGAADMGQQQGGSQNNDNSSNKQDEKIVDAEVEK
jgi:molecular chaperone DnaK